MLSFRHVYCAYGAEHKSYIQLLANCIKKFLFFVSSDGVFTGHCTTVWVTHSKGMKYGTQRERATHTSLYMDIRSVSHTLQNPVL